MFDIWLLSEFIWPWFYITIMKKGHDLGVYCGFYFWRDLLLAALRAWGILEISRFYPRFRRGKRGLRVMGPSPQKSHVPIACSGHGGVPNHIEFGSFRQRLPTERIPTDGFNASFPPFDKNQPGQNMVNKSTYPPVISHSHWKWSKKWPDSMVIQPSSLCKGGPEGKSTNISVLPSIKHNYQLL